MPRLTCPKGHSGPWQYAVTDETYFECTVEDDAIVLDHETRDLHVIGETLYCWCVDEGTPCGEEVKIPPPLDVVN